MLPAQKELHHDHKGGKKGLASAVLVVAVTAVAFNRHVEIVPQRFSPRANHHWRLVIDENYVGTPSGKTLRTYLCDPPSIVCVQKHKK